MHLNGCYRSLMLMLNFCHALVTVVAYTDLEEDSLPGCRAYCYCCMNYGSFVFFRFY